MPIPYELRYNALHTSCDVPCNEHRNLQCSSIRRHVSDYTNQLHDAQCFVRELLRLSTNSPHFIEVRKNPLLIPILSLIQFTPSHPTSFNGHYIILILSCHRGTGPPSGPLPSGFPTKILYACLICTICIKFPTQVHSSTMKFKVAGSSEKLEPIVVDHLV
jgi:hypothetical protein